MIPPSGNSSGSFRCRGIWIAASRRFANNANPANLDDLKMLEQKLQDAMDQLDKVEGK